MKAFERISIVPIDAPALSAGREDRQWAVDYCEAALRAEIVGNEIGNTERFIELAGNQPAKNLDIAPLKGCMHILDPDVVDQLKARIGVMQRHIAGIPSECQAQQ